VDQVGVESMDRYTVVRAKSGWAWIKEVELLTQFFEFCRDREWTTKNPARSLKRPRMIEANNIVPYSKQEIIATIAACDQIGRTSYERRRARAMTLLMRYAGLRISDVVTLSRDHIRGTRLEKRAIKNHRMIRVELPSAVLEALEVLPLPKGSANDNRRYFYKDIANLRSLVKGAWRTMSAVFKQAGVKAALPHRFRHTLASELLRKGGTLGEVASILGDSPATISRYYAKWTPEYQDRQDVLIRKIHGTDLTQAEGQAVKC
jgi:integrase